MKLTHDSDRYKDQGRYEEAETLCRRRLEIIKRTLGEEHPSL